MMPNKEIKTTFTLSLWCKTLTTNRLQVKLHFHSTFTPFITLRVASSHLLSSNRCLITV